MSRRKTTSKFIQDAIAIHGDRYDYSLSIYIAAHTKVKIICTTHGIFEQTPCSHTSSGKGCIKCAIKNNSDKIRGTTLKFIQKSLIKHGDKYNYSLVDYHNTHTKVNIICPEHGIFQQEPSAHLNHGCNKCAIMLRPLTIQNKSYMEKSWLDHIGLPDTNDYRRRTLILNNQWIYPDGYDPDTNTIYEFYGDYWHGNPNTHNPEHINTNNKKSFGELYQKTMNRETLIKSHGYNLVTIWENDWKNQ